MSATGTISEIISSVGTSSPLGALSRVQEEQDAGGQAAHHAGQHTGHHIDQLADHHGPQFRGHPMPPVNQQLLHSHNWLADEDPRRSKDFLDHLEQIEEFLEHILAEKAKEQKKAEDDPNFEKHYDYDEELYKDVKIMVHVHRDWIAKTTLSLDLVSFDLAPLPSHSNRLINQQAADHLKKQNQNTGFVGMREDHAPFTVHRDPDHDSFVKRLKEDSGQPYHEQDPETNLWALEGNAYSQSRLDPKTIPSEMSQLNDIVASTQSDKSLTEAENSSRTEHKFKALARRRGTQRAAVEMALNLLATNEEQKRPQDRFRRLQMPEPYVPPRKEVPLNLPLDPTQRPLELDTFAFTKILLEWRRSMQWDFSVSRDNFLHAHPLYKSAKSISPPANWNGPQFYLGDDAVSETEKQAIRANREQEIANLIQQLVNAEKKYPRPLLRQIIENIGRGSNMTLDSEIHNAHTIQAAMQQHWTDYIETLRVLAFDPVNEVGAAVSTSDPVETWNQFWESVDMTEASEFARYVMERKDHLPIEVLLEPTLDQPDPAPLYSYQENGTIEQVAMPVATIAKRYRKDSAEHGTSNVTATHPTDETVKKWLRKMRDEGFIVYHDSEDGSSDTISREVSWPEYSYAISEAEIKKLSETGIVIEEAHFKNRAEFFHFIALSVGLATQNMGADEDRIVEVTYRLSRQLAADAVVKNNMKSKRLYRRLREEAEAAGQVWEDPERPQPLQEHAAQLNAIAPDLFEELNEDVVNAKLQEDPNADVRSLWKTRVDAQELPDDVCAKILQKQLIEEANNNWDLKYPEKENAWSFAKSRLSVTDDPDWIRPEHKEVQAISTEIKEAQDHIKHLQAQQAFGKDLLNRDNYTKRNRLENKIIDLKDEIGITKPKKQFFSLLRWPLAAQSQERQAIIASTGPIIEPKPHVLEPPQKTIEEARQELLAPPPIEKHFGQGGAPYFPFGETPYQAAFLSFRMEEDLKDVPEFMDKDIHGNLINSEGRLVDAELNAINEEGKYIDINGEVTTVPIKASEFASVASPVALHVCSNGCPEHCPRQDTPPRQRLDLPRLPDDWQPISIPQIRAQQDATKAIYKDSDLYQRVGPHSTVYDEHVFGHHGDEYVKWLEVQDEEKKKKKELQDEAPVPGMSEKARGKLPATGSRTTKSTSGKAPVKRHPTRPAAHHQTGDAPPRRTRQTPVRAGKRSANNGQAGPSKRFRIGNQDPRPVDGRHQPDLILANLEDAPAEEEEEGEEGTVGGHNLRHHSPTKKGKK